MTCPKCHNEDVVDRLRVDMDTLRWVDMYDCQDCHHRWDEWSEPMQVTHAAQ